jgi:uncharacterized phiE125 gp8 family phage protein
VDSAVLITAPAIEPITLEEAQTHLKVDGEDDYLTSLIITARTMVERYLNRSLILQTWKAYSHCWDRKLCLPYPPLLAVTSVKYYNLDGVLTTLTPTTDYWVNTADQPGNVQMVYDFTAPELQYGRPNSIEVEYTAGYRATGTDAEKRTAVPGPIKHAIKVLMTDMHEHRGQYVIGSQANKLPQFVIDLIHSYKIYYS